MSNPSTIVPYSLQNASSLIEKLLPVQKLSVESYKEQMAGAGKTLTALGSYWKGRKPLILAKACVLGCLLPVHDDNLERDLEIFEMLMGMDDASMVVRLGRRPGIDEILAQVRLENLYDYFTVTPEGSLPRSAPLNLDSYGDASARRRGGEVVVTLHPADEAKPPVTIAWRIDVPETTRRRLEAKALPKRPYRELVASADRSEQVGDEVHAHIWDAVNAHLSTDAKSFPELVEQLGIMRFGHRPRVGDTFCGSGQIPFEAARLGCDVYASDLNPVAAMLTWGAFHIVGGTDEERRQLAEAQLELIDAVLAEIDQLGVETDGHGWRGKSYLYCLEAKCPQTGWMVPLLPTRVVSKGRAVIADLKPDPSNKRYNISLRFNVSNDELKQAGIGTLQSDGKGQESYLVHMVDGTQHRTKISTLRGDYQNPDKSTGNRLRLWEKSDFKPRPGDIFQERLYAIHWMRPKTNRKGFDYEFRTVTDADLMRERIVERYVEEHFAEWQQRGWIPDMRVESGNETDRLQRERGWTYWYHLFNPRQLLGLGLMRQLITSGADATLFAGSLDYSSKLCQWTTSSAGSGKSGEGGRTGGASDNPAHVFYNQALNTFYNFGCRSTYQLLEVYSKRVGQSPIYGRSVIENRSAFEISEECDLFITDPPYGDAVKYEEILEFFIAWLRRNPPPEFTNWVWDSRRGLAIKGEDEGFRQGMVAAYKRMAECMPDNGMQVIMFTHQDGSIWADMAGIVWASGLQVTAAWYVVTETDNPLREGSYVKGTVLLVVRKREGRHRTTSDDLAWEIQEEVEMQAETLSGLNDKAKGLYRDENLFEDADLQMAGYAAALRVLTRYAVIDGKEMAMEAIRPRVRGEQTFVDQLIEFAVAEANAHLVPYGISKDKWAKLKPAERFYLKLLELEAKGLKTLDNYQNFAKAFKVADYRTLLASQRANAARLKSATDFGRSDMGEGSQFHDTVLRGVLYAVMELEKGTDGNEVIAHLALNVPNYYDQSQREMVVELAAFLAEKLAHMRPDEASAARVLRELVRNQRM